MSQESRLDPSREVRADVIECLDELLTSRVMASVHYGGYAYEPVLRLLHRHLGTGFSVTDMPDRYHTGAAFFWEEDYPFPHERPNWLEGVRFYHEGIPPVELLIWDAPWSHAGQLSEILKRHCPGYILLADEASSAAAHPAYTWTLFPTYALGCRDTSNLRP